MAKINVYILNFHGIHSHIEIILENTSVKPHTYYEMNRWAEPENEWETVVPTLNTKMAYSVYSFDIEADAEEIKNEWIKYWFATKNKTCILGNNCSVAAQWFLTKFADIPKPSFSNVSWNHLILGVVWPSFIPLPLALPGRVMSNAKFHMEARNNPEIAQLHSHLVLCTTMAITALTFVASIFTMAAAIALLNIGIAALLVVGCSAIGLASTYSFFKTYNILSAKKISKNLKNKDEPPSLNEEPIPVC